MRFVFLTFVALASAATAAEPLTLEQLIARARSHDYRVQEAGAQLRVLEGKYQEARWAWFPKIDSMLMLAGPTPEAHNNGVGGPPTTAAGVECSLAPTGGCPTYEYDTNFGQLGVMVQFQAQGVLPLYTFGKLDALKAAGAHGVDVGVALKASAQDEAEFQVAQAYYGFQLARLGKKSLGETMQRLEDAAATIDRLRKGDSAQVTQMDVYKIEYFRKQVQARFGQLDSAQLYAFAAIRLLTAADVAERFTVAEVDFPEPAGTLPPVDAWIAEAERSRPEVRAITAGIGAREQEVVIRQRMFLPDFGLAGYVRYAYTTNTTRQISPFAYDPFNASEAGVALVGKYTWDFPTKSAQLEQARGELEKLGHQRELLMGGIRLEVQKAWGELADALVRSQAQAEAEASARRWANSAFAAFDLGLTDTRETVDSFTALGQASGEKFKAWYDVQLGLKALQKAVGVRVRLNDPPEKNPPAALVPALIPAP